MPKTEQIKVATINTFFGRAIKAEAGLESVSDSDVLLLQELYNPADYGLESSLNQQGFKIIAAAGHFGLGIALRRDSDINYVEGTVRETVLQKLSSLALILTKKYARHHLEFIDRGVLAAQFVTQKGTKITLASTHLPVVTAPRKRALFLSQLASEINNPYYTAGNLIIAGDMNHYPRAKKIDLAFRKTAKMNAVDLGNEYTWPSKRTGYLESKLNKIYCGQFDDILYRGGELELSNHEVVDVESDHRAVVATFSIMS